MKTSILFLAILFLLSSCSYYRVIPKASYSGQSIVELQRSGKVLILHRGEDAWLMKDVMSNDSLIQASLDVQLGYHVNYLYPNLDKLNQFKRRENPDVVNAIHLYTTDSTFNTFDTLVSIPMSSVYTINSYEYAQAPSRASLIVPLVVFPVVGLTLITLIAISSMEFKTSGDFIISAK